MSDHTVIHVRLPDAVLRLYQVEAQRQGMTTVELVAATLVAVAMAGKDKQE